MRQAFLIIFKSGRHVLQKEPVYNTFLSLVDIVETKFPKYLLLVHKTAISKNSKYNRTNLEHFLQ